MYSDIVRRIGRPRKFETPEDLIRAVSEYVEWVDSTPFKVNDFKGKDNEEVHYKKQRPYSFTGFSLFCGASNSFFREMVVSYPAEFSTVIENIKDMFTQHQVDGAISGVFRENLVARLNGIGEKSEVTNVNPTIIVNSPNIADAINKLKE